MPGGIIAISHVKDGSLRESNSSQVSVRSSIVFLNGNAIRQQAGSSLASNIHRSDVESTVSPISSISSSGSVSLPVRRVASKAIGFKHSSVTQLSARDSTYFCSSLSWWLGGA